MFCKGDRRKKRLLNLVRGTGLLICLGFVLISYQSEAEHQAHPDDMVVPTNNPIVVQAGAELFSQHCSACHGGAGKGGKAPCLTCGKFIRSGNSNGGIFTTIAVGISMTKMGAFGSTLTGEEILSLVTFIRSVEDNRRSNGEIPPAQPAEKPLQFPETN